MKFNDITGTDDIPVSIKKLKGAKTPPPITDYKKQYLVNDKRDILTQAKRPSKIVKLGPGEAQPIERVSMDTETVQTGYRKEEVNRLAFNLQKRIVQSSVAFTFGKPVLLTTEEDGDPYDTILKAVKKIFDKVKIDGINRRIMRELARCTEVAECWFPVTVESNEDYGFATPTKLRCRIFSPWDGNELYPYFDEVGDMTAFSRAYTMLEDGKEVNYFETYTDEQKIIWKEVQGAWQEVRKEDNPIKKIPVIYCSQGQVEWHDVQSLIERIEMMLSTFGDTNDYFGSPILALTGSVEGMARKGDSGKVISMEKGADAKFVSWTQGPDSIKLEMDTLVKFIYSLTQTPDLSFDSVKGVDMSGVAMKFLFTDAHLKVEEKREYLDDYLQRRVNVVKAYLATMKIDWKKQLGQMEIKPEIQPYTITSEQDLVELLATATGGKPIMSQETAVEQSGLVKDPSKEFEKIKAEREAERTLETSF